MKPTDNYEFGAILMSGLLFVCWVILTVIVYYQRRMWRGYACTLISVSFLIIFYRNLTGFTYTLTYAANALQLAAVVIFIQVSRILGNVKK